MDAEASLKQINPALKLLSDYRSCSETAFQTPSRSNSLLHQLSTNLAVIKR